MNRLALVALCFTTAAGCSKSAGNQDKVSSPPPASSGGEVIAVPKAGTGPAMGGAPAVAPPATATPSAADDRQRLQPDEGKLAIELPADAKAGAEAVAKITVTPASGYKVNTEYPTKLTLTAPSGVTLAKAEFVAGGHDKAKGDADTMEEKQLVFAVKLTRGRAATTRSAATSSSRSAIAISACRRRKPSRSSSRRSSRAIALYARTVQVPAR